MFGYRLRGLSPLGLPQTSPPVPFVRYGALVMAASPDDPADLRHQVTDIPPVRAQVTEAQLAARRCAGCGVVTRAVWPAAVPRTVLGPQLLAVRTLLTGRSRLSKREAARCVQDLFGAAVAVGTVSASEQQASGERSAGARRRGDAGGRPAGSGCQPGRTGLAAGAQARLAVDAGDGRSDGVPHRPLPGQRRRARPVGTGVGRQRGV